MNVGTAIALALGAVGVAFLVIRRQADQEGVSMCQKLAAIDGRAATACSILDALGIDTKDIAEAPGKFVGGTKGAITGIGGTVGGALGFGGDSEPVMCWVYKQSGKPRSEWSAEARRICP